MQPSLASVKDCLRSLPAWERLGEGAVSQLAEIGEVQTLEAGIVLFSEGQPHRWLYLLCQGAVRLEMLTTHSGRQTLLSVGPGDVLAWSALVGDGTMTATAIAAEPVVTVRFEADRLGDLLSQQPPLGYQVMSILTKALGRRLLATRLQLLDMYEK